MASPAHGQQAYPNNNINWPHHLSHEVSPPTPSDSYENPKSTTSRVFRPAQSQPAFHVPNPIIIAKATMLHLLSLEGASRRGSWGLRSPQVEQQESENLLSKTNFLFNNLLMQNFDESLYLYAMVLFNRFRLKVSENALDSRSSVKIESGEYIKVYSVCFFIAFKMLEENFKLFLEDIEILSGIQAESLRKLEEELMNEFFHFKVFVSQEEIIAARRWLMKMYQCNRQVSWGGCY